MTHADVIARWDAQLADRGLRDIDLARELGLSRQHISNMRHGRRPLSPTLLRWLGLRRDRVTRYTETTS